MSDGSLEKLRERAGGRDDADESEETDAAPVRWFDRLREWYRDGTLREANDAKGLASNDPEWADVAEWDVSPRNREE